MGALRRGARDADHRARRGLLRLGPARATGTSTACQRAVLREHRPRPRRGRAGRRRPGQGARLLHELVLRAPARDRARRAHRRARARRPQPRLLHERRQRGGRVGAQALPASTTSSRATAGRYKVIARELAYHGTTMGALTATGITGAAPPVRAAARPAAAHVANTNPYRSPGGRRPRPRRSRERIEFEGPETVAARDPRAGPELRRLLHPARGLLPARPRDLRRATASC